MAGLVSAKVTDRAFTLLQTLRTNALACFGSAVQNEHHSRRLKVHVLSQEVSHTKSFASACIQDLASVEASKARTKSGNGARVKNLIDNLSLWNLTYV